MTTYLIDPRRPGGPHREVRVDDTEQGAAFLAVLRGLYGDRLHPIDPPDEREEEVAPCNS